MTLRTVLLSIQALLQVITVCMLDLYILILYIRDSMCYIIFAENLANMKHNCSTKALARCN